MLENDGLIDCCLESFDWPSTDGFWELSEYRLWLVSLVFMKFASWVGDLMVICIQVMFKSMYIVDDMMSIHTLE